MVAGSKTNASATATKEGTMQKIRPCLWFDGNAEEAVKFYTSVFKNSKITGESRYPTDAPGMKAGQIMVIDFEIAGQPIMALNAGPEFKFNEAISLVVECDSQAEVDEYWSKLTAKGGEESVCGWLKDKYGLSWQITPRRLMEMIQDPDKDKAKRAMDAMMQMRKIDIAAVEKAYAG
jgi:predicted 3-demethylubiquinone-9 3-methyltransferase (glyoxalase superfamily)